MSQPAKRPGARWWIALRILLGIGGIALVVWLVRDVGLRAMRDAIVPALPWIPLAAGLELGRIAFDALSTLVAKRYRISSEATRNLVAAAYREGQRVGLDPLLIVAVIAVESRFNPIAESDAGAQGLMQVIPGYHKDKLQAAGVDSVLDPHDNIRLGAQILKEYIRRGGTEVAGLQIYSGAATDPGNAYAVQVLAEKQRLQQAIQRLRDRLRA